VEYSRSGPAQSPSYGRRPPYIGVVLSFLRYALHQPYPSSSPIHLTFSSENTRSSLSFPPFLLPLFQTGTNSGPSGSTPQAIFTPFNVTEAALAQEAVSYWTSFARAFDPSMYNSPFSPLWAGSDEGRLVLEESDGRNGTMTGSRMEVLSEMQEERCKVS
jgi:hypothetical protein